jgi:hypothetical protein
MLSVSNVLSTFVVVMIAKILKASKGFSGVLYSELKINEGKATFCGAYNFPFSDNNMQIDAYINYLEQLTETSKHNIKNRQFHAIISTKGHEHDQPFLTEIAQKWMEKMGYAEQPYLVYFHGDTNNNHVHIVSSRIDINGNRINPYMEGRRAGIAIQELMNENLSEKAKADLSDILNNYSFSTKAQFKLALERRGWKTSEKDGKINVVKFVKQGSVSIDDVTEKTKQYEQNKNRIRQLRAIFKKYSGMQQLQFREFMRTNFGIEVIFHTAAGHTTPYGYTVIDHNHKLIMKGSEIMPVQAITKNLTAEEHKRLVQEIVNNMMTGDDKLLYSDLKKTLYKNGYQINKNVITIYGDENPLIQLTDELYKKLRYNDRVNEVNKFVVKNAMESSVLSRLFHVRTSDIILKPDENRSDDAMRNLISSFGHSKEMLDVYLERNHLNLVSYNNNTYIIDAENKTISDVSGLGLDRGLNLDSFNEQYSTSFDDITDTGLGALSMLLGTFGSVSGGSSGEREHDDDNERRRKRRKKRNQ